MDELDDLFGNEETNSEVTTEVETTEQTTVEAPVENTTEEPTVEKTEADTADIDETTGQPRDDKGRFAPKEQTTVPVSALQSEREKARAAAQRAAEIEQRYNELVAQQQQTVAPDLFENPDGYTDHVTSLVQRQVEQRLLEIEMEKQQAEQAAKQQVLENNFKASAEKHSPETVQEAWAYAVQRAQVDDEWGQQGLSQPDPITWFLEEKARHAQFEEYARDPQGFIARKAAEMGIAGTTQTVAPAHNQSAVHAPMSIASAGSTTASAPKIQTSGEAFDDLFPEG
jgi:hypothetical protein